MKKTVLLFVLFAGSTLLAMAGLSVRRATCDYRVNPLLVADDRVEFGWQSSSAENGARQTAYQILVSSRPDGTGDCWNSGKTTSSQSQQITYSGKALEAGKTYFWSLQVWDEADKASKVVVSKFTMAPSSDQLTQAKWIGAIAKADCHLPQGRKDWHGASLKNEKVRQAWEAINPLALRSIQLRKTWTMVKPVQDARVYVSGLGHYELCINGKRIGKSQFDPLWSEYDQSVYYSAYDVTKSVRKGENVLGVVLGNGFYNAVSDRYSKLWVSFGPPTLLLRMDIRYTDGSSQTVVSDGSWKYALSPITFNNIYGGENYDATLEQKGWSQPGFKETDWKQVVLQESPLGKLRPQTAPAVEVMKAYPVKTVKTLSSGSHVLDMGQNLSGYPLIRVKGPRGSKIRIIPGEMLEKDRVSQKRSGGPYYFEYTLKGEGVETWSPKFSYYGYQYLQIDSADLYKADSASKRPVVLDVQSLFVYNSATETGTFTCSSDLYNRTHQLIQNAVKSNFQAVFTDCPHREKLGWIEENHLNGPVLLYNYDLSSFMRKMVQDMQDAQYPNGLVPSIVPAYIDFGGDFIDSPEWGVASILVPWLYYDAYGDASLIRQAYPMMKRYVDYLGTKADSCILSHGLGDWYDYGTHPAGYAMNSPINLSATAHYFYAVDYLVKTARLLGQSEEVAHYSSLLNAIRTAYLKKFYHPETKQFGTGSQYCNAVSLYLGLVPVEDKQAVLNHLLDDIQKHGNRLTTGDVGNRYLFQTLADNDLNEVMYALTHHYDVPGYGFQLQFGVTTLTEQWDPRRGNSWNHFMMGQIDEWFYKTLAGIQSDPEKPGYQHFFVKPTPVGEITSVSATHQTLYGTIRVNWVRKGKEFLLQLDVPVNTTATVCLPGQGHMEHQKGKGFVIAANRVNCESGKHCIRYMIK